MKWRFLMLVAALGLGLVACGEETTEETETMTAFIERQKKLRGDNPNAESLALRDFCHLVLCLNEFVYIE